MMKLGDLILRNGRWDEKPILEIKIGDKKRRIISKFDALVNYCDYEVTYFYDNWVNLKELSQ